MDISYLFKNLVSTLINKVNEGKTYTDTEIDSLYCHVGDTVTNSTFFLAHAVVTGSASSLFVTVPIGKNLDKVRNATVTVTKFICGFRTGSGGYLNGDGYNYVANSSTIAAFVCPETQTITIQFQKSGTWGTNNTIYVAIINPNNFEVTFS